MPRPSLLKTTSEIALYLLVVIVPLLVAITFVLLAEPRHDNRDP